MAKSRTKAAHKSFSERQAKKFGLDKETYSDENIAAIADFMYHCIWHDLFDVKVKNPAVVFEKDVKAGAYKDTPDDEYKDLLNRVKIQSSLWHDRERAPIMSIMIAIFKKCPKEDALELFGDLIRYMIDPASWSVDAKIFDDGFNK